MNLFKILIPKDKAQEITELESFTVDWEIKTGWSNNTKKAHKVFIIKEQAEEFEKQLKESAKFLGCWIDVSLYRN